MVRGKKTDLKFCIERKSEFSKKLSDCFEKGKTLPFEELWGNRAQLELTDQEKQKYDIIQFSFVMLNNEDKPLFIERGGESHRITTGGSILQSCSPVMSPPGTFSPSMDDIKFYFKQEVEIEHPKPLNYKIDLLGIARNVRKSINYYFYIFRVKFPVRELNLSLKKDLDVTLGFYDPNLKSQLLKGKKVDLLVLKALSPSFQISSSEVRGCILHTDVDHTLRNMLFITKKPKIREKFVANTQKEGITVCLVQLDYSLTERFPYTLKGDNKIAVKKILETIKIAKEKKVDIVCFPELSFAKEWVEGIKSQCEDMIVICGSFYDSKYNVCPIIIDGKVSYCKKCHPSIFEEENGEGMKQGDEILVFQTKCGKISVLTCIDFEYERSRVYEHDVSLIINPRHDIDREYTFQKIDKDIDLPDASNRSAFILQVNAATVKWGEDKGGGGTCIIGYEKKYRLEKYKKQRRKE
jgi:hypothetical protein